MKLGIGTYTYMWSIGFDGAAPSAPMSALDVLEQARQLGVDVVQYGPNLSLGSLSSDERNTLIKRADALAIEIEVGMKGLTADDVQRELELANRVGATLLRTVPDYDRRAPVLSEQQLFEILSDLEPHCAAARVRLAVENATIPASTLSGALDRLGSEWVGITLDTVNSLAIAEGTEHVVSTLARHTLCVHVKDFSVDRIWHTMGFTVEGRPAGGGQLNIPLLLQRSRSAGRDANAILELWTPRQGSVEETIATEQAWAVDSIRYLRTLIPEHRA